jgi:DNA-binding HxlR family transcriptional regulator
MQKLMRHQLQDLLSFQVVQKHKEMDHQQRVSYDSTVTKDHLKDMMVQLGDQSVVVPVLVVQSMRTQMTSQQTIQ